MTTFSHRILDNSVFIDEVVETSIGVRRQMSGPQGTEEIIDGVRVDKAVEISQERDVAARSDGCEAGKTRSGVKRHFIFSSNVPSSKVMLLKVSLSETAGGQKSRAEKAGVHE